MDRHNVSAGSAWLISVYFLLTTALEDFQSLSKAFLRICKILNQSIKQYFSLPISISVDSPIKESYPPFSRDIVIFFYFFYPATENLPACQNTNKVQQEGTHTECSLLNSTTACIDKRCQTWLHTWHTETSRGCGKRILKHYLRNVYGIFFFTYMKSLLNHTYFVTAW